MKTKSAPLTERGTTGLLQYLASGTDKMFPARMATVRKIIQARYSDQWQIFLFVEVARDERAKRTGQSTPKLSPLARMEACKAGDHTWSHH